MRPDLRHVSLPPRVLPGDILANLEVFAIGDVHGQADLLAGCLEVIARTPRALGTERLVVFLGDLIDRGPDSLRAIGLMMNASRLARADRVVLLPGNHEQVLLDALDGNAEPWLAIGGKAVMREVDPA
ncbi:metallophosphoesterase [uncultured Jannaschia sp.]|uniref:metallophosphoesterase n=1 Tax=uncultured Jannaschia sp. TaxID=293347 RepID=UPI00261DBE06|nr:metallophosphoesterase [uncultured Jannaschia sp.]